MNAHASPMGTSIRSCGVNCALPKACTTEQGSVNVNTIFDTTSPGRFPNEPDRPAKYPAMIIDTNAATFMRTPSTAPPPQYKKKQFPKAEQSKMPQTLRLSTRHDATRQHVTAPFVNAQARPFARQATKKGASRSQRLISCYEASLIPEAPSCRSTSSEGTEQAPRP